MPAFFNYYRLIYNSFALLSFAIILMFQMSLPAQPIDVLPQWLIGVGYVVTITGIGFIGAAIKNYDTKEFVGLKPMNEFNPAGKSFIITGLNSYVRHPLYFGIIIALIGFLLISFDYKTLIFFAISLLYLFVGAKLEERKLITLYGQSYLEYQKKVGMLIPFI